MKSHKGLNFDPSPRDCIAVLGGAGRITDEQVIAGFKVGREIARRGKNLITGGTTGIPYAAAIGARMEGAVVVGVSPASSREEHADTLKKPLDYADVLVHAGLGFEGRQPLIVRSAKGAIFVGGEFGTLTEFGAAFTTGDNVLGILEGVGGLTSFVREMVSRVHSQYGSVIIYESDPIELVAKVCSEVDQRYPLSKAYDRSREIGSGVRAIVERFLQNEPAVC